MFENNLAYAQLKDQQDPLKQYRDQFLLPTDSAGNFLIYLCGNSLGLQAKHTSEYLQQELSDWATLGVEGHTDAKHPWLPYHEFLTNSMAKIVGAKPEEVVIMNSLTANLHFMMVSFYQPTSTKYKIIIESDAFPSDKYAVESQLKYYGFDPHDGLILWKPREGEELCRFEDLEQIMSEQGDEIALIMIGNPNYYSGQVFPSWGTGMDSWLDSIWHMEPETSKPTYMITDPILQSGVPTNTSTADLEVWEAALFTKDMPTTPT